MSVLGLHLGLNHINWIVCHGGAETGKTASKKIHQDLVTDVMREVALSVSEDNKAHSLVGRLLQDGGHNTGVETFNTGLRCNRVDSLEKVAVLRLWRQLIVNQLRLESLLRGDDSNGFAEAGRKTAHESVTCAVTCEHVGLGELEGTKTNGVLGHGEEEQSGVTAVEAEESIVAPSLLGESAEPELVLGLVNLKHSLQVLGRVSARNLNGAHNTT